MAQPAHVPKFGNWDGDNVPYTTFFENAQKNKNPGLKNFNPNDPEQNPDAFVSGIFPSEFELRNSNSSVYGVVTRQNDKHGSRRKDELRQEYKQAGAPRGGDIAKNSKNGNANRMPSRYLDDDSVCIPPSPLRTGRPSRTDAMHDTPSSVPKFGIWDEMDPKSGDGFTMIFNRVKQEKQAAAAKLPRVPADTNIYSNNRKNSKMSSSRSKMGCCTRPAVDE